MYFFPHWREAPARERSEHSHWLAQRARTRAEGALQRLALPQDRAGQRVGEQQPGDQ